jgi:hypothetical protein
MSYKPTNTTDYQGKQVIIDSDRLLFNAKNDSILLFSDKAIGFSTKGSIHFDTSNTKDSKIVINSPNIYLGLKVDKNLPTEPAVLGDELDDWLTGINGLLDVMEGIIDDIIFKVSYTAPGGFTGPNPRNIQALSLRRTQIENLRDNVHLFKSKITKLT